MFFVWTVVLKIPHNAKPENVIRYGLNLFSISVVIWKTLALFLAELDFYWNEIKLFSQAVLKTLKFLWRRTFYDGKYLVWWKVYNKALKSAMETTAWKFRIIYTTPLQNTYQLQLDRKFLEILQYKTNKSLNSIILTRDIGFIFTAETDCINN